MDVLKWMIVLTRLHFRVHVTLPIKKHKKFTADVTSIHPDSIYITAPTITTSILSSNPREYTYYVENYLCIFTITLVYVTKV
jgi:hypothetical protein